MPSKPRPGRKAYLKFPKELVEHAKSLFRQGFTVPTVAAACPGVPMDTLARWRATLAAKEKLPTKQPKAPAEFAPSVLPDIVQEAREVAVATKRRNVKTVLANTLETIKTRLETDLALCDNVADQLNLCVLLNGVCSAQEFIEANPPLEKWTDFNALLKTLGSQMADSGKAQAKGIDSTILKMHHPVKRAEIREAERSGAKPVQDREEEIDPDTDQAATPTTPAQ